MTTYILPGMGADSSMYGPAFKKLKDIQYLDWPTYNNEKSIKDISIRIINEYNIDSSDIVGGSSLGGIVSAEIAKNVEVKKIILIGSTLTAENISPILKKLSVLSEIAPINLIKAFVGKAGVISKNHLLKVFGNVPTAHLLKLCARPFLNGTAILPLNAIIPIFTVPKILSFIHQKPELPSLMMEDI